MFKYKNSAYTRCPIPDYDITGTELWLEKMASHGYILKKDGITANIAAFEIAEPRHLKYRLDAAAYGTGLFSRGGNGPEPEQIELSHDMGWDYIALRKDFYIYVSEVDNSTEFHSDPQIRAMALKSVRNRCIDTFISQLLWLVPIGFALWRLGFFSLVLSMRTWFSCLCLLIVLLGIFDSGRRMVKLMKARKHIMEKGFADAFTNINSKGSLRLVGDLLQVAMAVTVIVVALQSWGDDIMGSNEIPISEYKGHIPFATMADFVPEGQIERADYFDFGNTVQVWSDPLSPVNIIWDEIGDVTGEHGGFVDGGLNISYHETASEFIAHSLAVENHRYAGRQKSYRELELNIPGLDYCAAYSDRLHFPTVIMQRDNIYVEVSFYQTHSTPMALEDWAEIIYKSVFVS